MKTPFELLAASGIPVLLVGGQALHVYRYTRQTIDFDFMVAETNYPSLRQYLESQGFEEQGLMGRFGRFRTGPGQEPVLDIGKVEDATFEKLWAASEEHEWGDVRLRVPAFLHLVALKLHAAKNPHRNDRDLGDVVELLRLNPHRYSQADLEETCLRFGRAGIYDRLKTVQPYEHPQP